MVAPPVPPHIAGDEKIDRDWLIAHLGRGPFFTWQRLLWCRNPLGVTWVTREGIAKHISLYVDATGETRRYSARSVELHLKRLRTVLLVKDFPTPDVELVNNVLVRRQNRIVYGSIVKPKEIFTIPDFVKAALAAQGPVKWGGGRKGSGRPRGSKNVQDPAIPPAAPVLELVENDKPAIGPEKISSCGDEISSRGYVQSAQPPPQLDLKTPPQLEFQEPQNNQVAVMKISSRGDEINQVAVPIKNPLETSLKKTIVLFASQKERGGPGGPPSSLNLSEKNEGGGEGGTIQNPNSAASASNHHPAAPKKETPPGEQKPHAVPFLHPNLGIPPTSALKSSGGANCASGGLQAWWDNWKANRPKTWRRPAPVFGECGIPAFPRGLDYHFPPPPMPTLRHKEDIDAGVMFLERWYNAALTSRYVKVFPVRAPKAGNLRQYWELAVSTCVDEGISAGAWVAFSIDEWRVTAPQRALKSPPDVKFVFGPRMQSRLWVFRDMEGEYVPSKMLSTPDARSVLDRLHSVAAFAIRADWDERKVQAELARQFPNGFEREVLQARRTTEATGNVLKQQIRSGKWIWGKDFDGKKARALAARRPAFNEGAHG